MLIVTKIWDMVLKPPNSQFSIATSIKLEESHSESDLFAGASEGKAQIKRFKLFMSCQRGRLLQTIVQRHLQN